MACEGLPGWAGQLHASWRGTVGSLDCSRPTDASENTMAWVCGDKQWGWVWPRKRLEAKLGDYGWNYLI